MKRAMTAKNIIIVIILGGTILGTSLLLNQSSTDENLITHVGKNSKELTADDVRSIENRLRNQEGSLTLPLVETLKILQEMTEFELGRFLLKNGGISGYWTAYWLIHGPAKKLDHPLENWLINKAPAFIASRERFKIFATCIQKHLTPHMKLASVPCGLMDDLLHLDYTKTENVTLYGFDLDEESIELGKENAKKYGKESMAFFEKRNAWNLNDHGQYDLITSNGLNFYEQDDARVVALYKSFHNALKRGGILVTSFITPPPMMDKNSPWRNFNIDDMKMQKAIFGDIMSARWQAMRSESLTRNQLEQAGFKVLDVIYDTQGIFPTVIAEKGAA